MALLSPAAEARRRTGRLGRGPGRSTGASARAERAVEALALPGDPAAHLRLVAAVGGGSLLVAAVVGGPRLAAAAVVALAAGVVGLRRTAQARRRAAYDRELPELLEGVARRLRAGGSLRQAIGSAAPPPTSPSGLAGDWRRVDLLTSALGVGAALDDWADGAPSNVRLAAAALAMAAETGGSAARAVDGVAATLRARAALADEVRALSSQARASAAVIAVAPLAFGVVAGAVDDRTAAFFATPAGLVLLGAGIALDVLGGWWMARLCRVPA